jgi:carbon monoxide dehydrogenase subunit G
MDIVGSQRIPATRQQVWDALNDPEILKACIRGCESFETNGPNRFTATVAMKVGPIKAVFQGEVTLSDIDPLRSYVITGEGKGGVAGFAKGKAKVTLDDDANETLLSYSVEARLGGKLAQLGSRLIDGVARKEADSFFSVFKEVAARGKTMSSKVTPNP